MIERLIERILGQPNDTFSISSLVVFFRLFLGLCWALIPGQTTHDILIGLRGNHRSFSSFRIRPSTQDRYITPSPLIKLRVMWRRNSRERFLSILIDGVSA